jgi:hypothetical protein
VNELSDFTILLARQRSGTNAVRSVLESHREIFCLNEVFNFPDKDSDEPLLRHTNFFTFLQEYAQGDLRQAFPDRHEEIFLDFLRYLRCFSPKPHIVIDVKYNTTQFLTKPWADNMTAPYLYTLLRRHHVRVLNIRRRNYLRYAISNVKALETSIYSVTPDGNGYRDQPVTMSLGDLGNELEKCRDEDSMVERWFAGSPLYFAYEYADLFPDHSSEMSSDFLAKVARWLDVSEDFQPITTYRKQSYLPLAETIENYDEVVELLVGTEFEYCLDDEPSYRLLVGSGAHGRGGERTVRSR